MKPSLNLLFALLAFTGCARFSTTQTDLSYDDQGKPQRQITTRAAAYTFFAAKSALANWKATQTDKTQGASVGSLNQETANGWTNMATLVEAIVKGAVAGAK